MLPQYFQKEASIPRRLYFAKKPFIARWLDMHEMCVYKKLKMPNLNYYNNFISKYIIVIFNRCKAVVSKQSITSPNTRILLFCKMEIHYITITYVKPAWRQELILLYSIQNFFKQIRPLYLDPADENSRLTLSFLYIRFIICLKGLHYTFMRMLQNNRVLWEDKTICSNTDYMDID